MSDLQANDCTCWGDHNGWMENPDCIVHGENRSEERRQATLLTFETFSLANAERSEDWQTKDGAPSLSKQWGLSDWGVAVAEEAGEVCGAIKRFNRVGAGQIRPGDPTQEEAIEMVKKEIGDVATYLELLAQHLGTDLGECCRLAFNSVSERQGLPHRI